MKCRVLKHFPVLLSRVDQALLECHSQPRRWLLIPVTYDQLITQYRTSWDLTQEHFAELFDVVPRCVQRWEHGVTPSAKNRQKLALCQQAGEDAMKRCGFLRWFLAVSLPFATPSQAPQLHQFLESIEPSTTHLAGREERCIVETLTKTCWQRLRYCQLNPMMSLLFLKSGEEGRFFGLFS